jgi:biotin carboxyl carrier protein
LQEIVSLLGGANIEELKKENQTLKEDLELLSRRKQQLEVENNELRQHVPINQEPDAKTKQHLVSEPSVDKQDPKAEKRRAFEFFSLPLDASSQDICLKYNSLKKELLKFLDCSPKRLRAICEERLKALEEAFHLIFPEKKKLEEQEIWAANEVFQLPAGTSREAIERSYEELKRVCLGATKSSDPSIKEAATQELERLEDAFLILTPKLEQGSGTEVVMPQMGESILEGTITKWFKQVGDRVERDEPLFEISTDKVDAEIPSPAGGILREILFVEGDTVPINETVAIIRG